MKVNTYHHIIVRVDYPREGGYRREPKSLPSWIHLTVTEDVKGKYLTVHSQLHVNKAVKVGPTYSSSYKDYELIEDLSGEIARRFNVF